MKNQKIELKNIKLPVRIMHEHLDAKERIDSLDSRIDTLDISILVSYQSKVLIGDHSLDGVWNYADIYNQLCLSDVRTVTGALEGILDETLAIIEQSLIINNFIPNKITVSANRMGLSVGYPKLIVEKTFVETQSNEIKNVKNKRSAGICDYPLTILVNHGWINDDGKIEHKDIKYDLLKISFNAETIAKSLNKNDLSGLYNYAALIHSLDKLQGMEITGPVEKINDLISEMLEKDALDAGLILHKTEVRVERTGFARMTPVFILEKFY